MTLNEHPTCRDCIVVPEHWFACTKWAVTLLWKNQICSNLDRHPPIFGMLFQLLSEVLNVGRAYLWTWSAQLSCFHGQTWNPHQTIYSYKLWNAINRAVVDHFSALGARCCIAAWNVPIGNAIRTGSLRA